MKDGLGGLGGLGGLAGLLGVKGLKGFGGLGLLALLKILKPLLLPLLLPFLLLLPLLLLFIPIPVITIPTGRSIDAGPNLGRSISDKMYATVRMAEDVLSSDRCIERVACEIGQRTQGTSINKIVSE